MHLRKVVIFIIMIKSLNVIYGKIQECLQLPINLCCYTFSKVLFFTTKIEIQNDNTFTFGFYFQLNEIREVVDGELGFATSQDKDLKSHEQVNILSSFNKPLSHFLEISGSIMKKIWIVYDFQYLKGPLVEPKSRFILY